MRRVSLGLGSNIDRHRHIAAALDALSAAFGRLSVSPVYESEAVGFVGAPFLNLVVIIDTDLAVGELVSRLRAIEGANGRQRQSEKFSDRTLDIDILTYGDEVGCIDGVDLPRSEVLEHAYVLKPLADLLPKACHPVKGASYAALWQQFRGNRRLKAVPFEWHGTHRPAE